LIRLNYNGLGADKTKNMLYNIKTLAEGGKRL